MKDITHYFQTPKNTSNLSAQNSRTESIKCKRKTNGNAKLTNGNSPEDLPSKKILHRGRPAEKTKPKKMKRDPSTDCESDYENTPVTKKPRTSTFDDDEFPITPPIIRTYSRRKPVQQKNVESFVGILENSVSNDASRNGFNESHNEDSIESHNFQVRVVLQDCLKDISSETTVKVNGPVETEESDSDCFVPEKKSKKAFKSKNKEDEPGKNNLFNYFNKLNKVPVHEKSSLNTIVVQAVVHSPPNEKRTPTRKEVSESPIITFKKSTSKNKSCNFDNIEVLESEIIPVKETESKNTKNTPKTPQSEDDSQTDSSSNVKPWKMRVKLTPSSKLEDIVINVKPKYKRIRSIVSDDETVNETKAESSEDDVEIISVTKPNPKPEIKKMQPVVKLAPLFCKKPETKNTPIRIPIDDEAKRNFLKSGPPEAIKRKMEEQKNLTVEDDYKGEYTFPKFSHVQQKIADSFVWNLKERLDFEFKQPEVSDVELSSQSYSSLISKDLETLALLRDAEKIQFDLKNEINSLKKQEPNANVSDIYSSIKRLNKVSSSVTGISWTDKYKPFVFGDMIGNTNALLQLKEWIESHKRLKQIFLESDTSSGGEFVDSDDSCSSADVKNNVAILVGPPGCGKTCAIYMLANELGFKVLEVNAGSNRNGKKIIDEFLEATQSHRVKRILGTQTTLQLAKSKKKKDKESKKDKKTMSLILIEDADILFENHDDGFLSALNSLTSLSKRPLVFTVNNLNCPHLQRYRNSQNLVLRFDYPSRSSINAWLKTIALMEGVKLTDELLIELHRIAGSDLRKNLLQLEMLVSSKYQHRKCTGEQSFHGEWLSHVRCIGDKRLPKVTPMTDTSRERLFSDDEAPSQVEDFKKPEIKDKKTVTEIRNDRERLLNSAKFLDYAANLDTFNCNHDEKIFPAQIAHLGEDDAYENRISGDILDFLKRKLFFEYDENTTLTFKKYFNAVSQNSRIKAITENVFVSFPRIGYRRARTCDYLPFIREIARTEKNKASSSMRRSNRYFSYLKSVNVDVTDKEIEILCDTFV